MLARPHRSVKRRWIAASIVAALAVEASLVACNALLGNEEPMLARADAGDALVNGEGGSPDADAGGDAAATDAADAGRDAGELILGTSSVAIEALAVTPDELWVHWTTRQTDHGVIHTASTNGALSDDVALDPDTSAPIQFAATNAAVWAVIPPAGVASDSAPLVRFSRSGSGRLTQNPFAYVPAPGDIISSLTSGRASPSEVLFIEGTGIHECTASACNSVGGADMRAVSALSDGWVSVSAGGLWRNSTIVVDMPDAGGTATLVASGGVASSANFDAFWSGKANMGGGFIRRSNVDAGVAATVEEPQTQVPTALALGARAAYVAVPDATAQSWKIIAMSRAAKLQPGVFAVAQQSLVGLVVREKGVYWTRRAANGSGYEVVVRPALP